MYFKSMHTDNGNTEIIGAVTGVVKRVLYGSDKATSCLTTSCTLQEESILDSQPPSNFPQHSPFVKGFFFGLPRMTQLYTLPRAEKHLQQRETIKEQTFRPTF